jgi:uncharacterized YigZ family protein
MTRLSLAAPATHSTEVKKSRFVVHASAAASPEAALAYRDQVADPAATHNCWAYRIGPLYRFSDDNEPGGSAGRPILAAIDGQGLDRVIAVVTRYFGGTKLGVGGLVRAYGGAVAECLRLANKIELKQMSIVHISSDFSHGGKIHTALAQQGAHKLDERFAADGVELTVEVPSSAVDSLRQALADLSRGSIKLRVEAAP